MSKRLGLAPEASPEIATGMQAVQSQSGYELAVRAFVRGLGTPVVSKKRCRRCLAEKPASAFHRHQGSSDGLQSWCKRCLLRQQRLARAVRTATSQAARRQEIAERAEHGKACSSCAATKPLAEFGADARKPDGRQSVCLVCAAPGRRKAWAKYRAKPASCGDVSTMPTDDRGSA